MQNLVVPHPAVRSIGRPRSYARDLPRYAGGECGCEAPVAGTPVRLTDDVKDGARPVEYKALTHRRGEGSGLGCSWLAVRQEVGKVLRRAGAATARKRY